jgi:regulatory protein
MPGVITGLKWQGGRDRRVNIYLDGQFAFGLSESLAASLHIGQELSVVEIRGLKAQDEVERAYTRALRLINRRPRSEWELRRYFDGREISAEGQRATLERLKDRGLVDDRAFAEGWIENRNAFRPRGAFALRAELRRKGVGEAVIRESLRDFDEEAAARSAANQRAERWKDLSEQDFRRRLGGYLRRRGFLHATIMDVVGETWQEMVGEFRESESEGDA